MALTRKDYKVLYALYQYECTTEMKAITKAKIEEITEVSNSKVRSALKIFIDLEYVKEGASDNNAKTYYITKQGIDKVLSLMEG